LHSLRNGRRSADPRSGLLRSQNRWSLCRPTQIWSFCERLMAMNKQMSFHGLKGFSGPWNETFLYCRRSGPFCD
jgi:hypothetical protein